MQGEGQTNEGISVLDHDLLLTSSSERTSSSTPSRLSYIQELEAPQATASTTQIQCYCCQKIFAVDGLGIIHACPYCSSQNQVTPVTSATGLIAVPVATSLPSPQLQGPNSSCRCLKNPCYIAAVVFYIISAVVLVTGISLVASPPRDCSSNTNADNGSCFDAGAGCCQCQYTGSRCHNPAPDPWIGIVVILIGFPTAIIVGAICNCCGCWCWPKKH